MKTKKTNQFLSTLWYFVNSLYGFMIFFGLVFIGLSLFQLHAIFSLEKLLLETGVKELESRILSKKFPLFIFSAGTIMCVTAFYISPKWKDIYRSFKDE